MITDNNNNKTKHAHRQADYLINIKLGKQNFVVIQIKRLLRVIRKKTNKQNKQKKTTTHFCLFFIKSDYNMPDEFIDLIQLPSYNHVHYTIIDFNEFNIGVYCHATLSKQIM